MQSIHGLAVHSPESNKSSRWSLMDLVHMATCSIRWAIYCVVLNPSKSGQTRRWFWRIWGNTSYASHLYNAFPNGLKVFWHILLPFQKHQGKAPSLSLDLQLHVPSEGPGPKWCFDGGILDGHTLYSSILLYSPLSVFFFMVLKSMAYWMILEYPGAITSFTGQAKNWSTSFL